MLQVVDPTENLPKCGRPLETHNSADVDHSTGQVVGGEDLDDNFNGQILLPNNPRPADLG